MVENINRSSGSKEIRDRLNVDKETKDRDIYEELANTIFKGKNRKEQFLLAMAFGFKNETCRKLSTKDAFFLAKDLKFTDDFLLNVVAIGAASSVDILEDRNAVYEIAEEYAHAGIRILHEKVKATQFGSFDKQFEKDLVEIYNNLDLGEKNEENTSS